MYDQHREFGDCTPRQKRAVLPLLDTSFDICTSLLLLGDMRMLSVFEHIETIVLSRHVCSQR